MAGRIISCQYLPGLIMDGIYYEGFDIGIRTNLDLSDFLQSLPPPLQELIQDYMAKSVQVIISTESYCCERSGCFVYWQNRKFEPNQLPPLLGFTVTSIRWGLSPPELFSADPYFRDDEHFAVVELQSSGGPVRFVLFNHHNGYYSHTIGLIQD